MSSSLTSMSQAGPATGTERGILSCFLATIRTEQVSSSEHRLRIHPHWGTCPYSNSSLAMTVSTTAAMPGTDDVTTRAMDPISAMTQLLLRKAKMPPTTASTPGITIANGISATNSGISPSPGQDNHYYAHEEQRDKRKAPGRNDR